MEFKSFKTIEVNDDLAVAVNETERRIQIIQAPKGIFGGAVEVWLSFEEFQLVINALKVLEVERNVVKKPRKKKDE